MVGLVPKPYFFTTSDWCSLQRNEKGDESTLIFLVNTSFTQRSNTHTQYPFWMYFSNSKVVCALIIGPSLNFQGE